MTSSVQRAGLVLLAVLYVLPDLSPLPHGNQAQAAAITLNLNSNIADNEIRMREGDVRVVSFNYTLNVSGNSNHTLALAVCVTVDHPGIARAWVSEDTTVPLNADLSGAFNVTIQGLFLGRANLHVHFVVGHNNHVQCGQQDTENLQTMLKVTESNRGEELPMNISKTASSSSSVTEDKGNSSSSKGIHSGASYQVAVLRRRRTIDEVFRVGTVILIVIINVGMGSKLDLQVVKSTLRRPFAPVTGLCSQFIVMPLVSFAVTHLFTLQPGMALGFFALGCSPGGAASNIFCYLLGGDVSLSITMTFISTVAALGLFPLWMFSLGRHLSGVENINIPFETILLSLLALVGPVGVGLLLKAKKPNWARLAVKASKVAFAIFIVFMLTLGIYANLYLFALMKGVTLAAAAILPYAGFLLGGLVSLILRLPAKHVITIAIETGIQNTGVAIIVLLLSLGQPEADLSIVAPATSSMFTPIPLWIAVICIKVRNCYRRKKNATATTSSSSNGDDANANTTNSPDRERNGQAATTTTTTTTTTNGENLCKQLFGKGESGQRDCKGKLCWYCMALFQDKETVIHRETGREVEMEISVISEANGKSPEERPGTEKRGSYEFDNLALEIDYPVTHQDGETCGDGPAEDSDRDRASSVSGSESAPDEASIRSDRSSPHPAPTEPCEGRTNTSLPDVPASSSEVTEC